MKRSIYLFFFLLSLLCSISTICAEESILQVGELKLWTETFGQKGKPAVLMIMGAGCTGYTWPDELCEAIAQKGYFVIRYDHRDIGHSSCINYSTSPYTLNELAEDALAILEYYQVKKAHVVGASMGGMIGQMLAIHHPEKVITLISIMSTADHTPITCKVFGKQTSSTLPPPHEKVLRRLVESRLEACKTVEDRIKRAIRNYRTLAASEEEDEQFWREMEERCEKSCPSYGKNATNHWFAVAGSEARLDKMHKIRAPTLVIHGEEDPLIPVEHGKATARAIPQAELLILPKMGHVISRKNLPLLQKAILNHIQKAPRS
jgi:pimeloyl-ACP methyl ester carboxylesterase